MKISKLFHWLYAILMFLPIMVFIPNAFYYGFNEHAVAQEKTEQVPVYYETNQVTTGIDFIVGRVYSWNNNLTPVAQSNYTNIAYIYVLNGIYPSDIRYKMLINPSGNLVLQYSTDISINAKVIDFKIDELMGTTVPSNVIEHFSSCNHLYIKEYQPMTTNMSITDSMSYAWDSVWQNDLFSWTYDSFLTQPFLYITNLFSVPSTNTLIYCLSYWLNISIIWLTFDLVMYVPLLVHRWLDKGVIE